MVMTAVQVELDNILLRMRIELCKKGHNCMLLVERAFRSYALNEPDLINYAEFEQLLARIGLFLPLSQLALLNKRFDAQSTGLISIQSFLHSLAPPMSPYRHGLVHSVFESLAINNAVPIAHLLSRFHPEHHPKVLAHDKSAIAIKNEFVDNFESFAEGDVISHDRFMAMFDYISASIPLDDQRFAEVVNNVFKISVKAEASSDDVPIDPAYLASVGQVLKEKIRQKTRGQESEAYTLTRVFRHFDIEDTGKVKFQEWSKALERFGILMPEKESQALFADHDPDTEGAISYAKFVHDLYQWN